MSQTEDTLVAPPSKHVPPAARLRLSRRTWIALLAAAVVVAVVVVLVASGVFGGASGTGGGTSDNAFPTSLAPVTRRSLSSQTQVSATLGYAAAADRRGAGRDGTVEPVASRAGRHDSPDAAADGRGRA